MIRTLISLPRQDKAWLERQSQQSGLSMAALVREAVRRMRRQEDASLDELLRRTSDTWRHGDGLAYQRRIRKEWR